MKLLPMLLHTCYFYRVQRKFIPRDRKSIKCPVPRDGNPVPHGTVNFPVIGTVTDTGTCRIQQDLVQHPQEDPARSCSRQYVHAPNGWKGGGGGSMDCKTVDL